MSTYVYIDASNIIYGVRDQGWKVDFKKLYKYLSERYGAKKVFYFAGKEESDPKQEKFYALLSKLGFELVLKPVKLFRHNGGKIVRKANCDVDLTFYAMRDINKFKKVILLSGDGDFEILVKYFVKLKKEVVIIASAKRTAREIKKLKGIKFNDLGSLKSTLLLAKK